MGLRVEGVTRDGYVVTVAEGAKAYYQSEMAAWYTNYDLKPGKYPISIYHSGDYNPTISVSVSIPGTVTSCNNASYFGGVAVTASTCEGKREWVTVYQKLEPELLAGPIAILKDRQKTWTRVGSDEYNAAHNWTHEMEVSMA